MFLSSRESTSCCFPEVLLLTCLTLDLISHAKRITRSSTSSSAHETTTIRKTQYNSYEDYFQVFRGFSKKSYPETYIWSLFKATKNYGAPMKPSTLFCFKDTKNFAALLFLLAACNEKFQQANTIDVA